MHRLYEHIVKNCQINIFELDEWDKDLRLKSLDEEFYSRKLLETKILFICESKVLYTDTKFVEKSNNPSNYDIEIPKSFRNPVSNNRRKISGETK